MPKLLTALGLSAALLLSALAGAVIVGNATAEESKIYYACADKKTGVLRLVNLKTKCKAGETRVVWGNATPTPTPTPTVTPTPTPTVTPTPTPTVTCNFSQSGTFVDGGDVIGRCAIPWTGLSRVVWSATATLDLRPVVQEDGDTYASVNFYPIIERAGDANCLLVSCVQGLMNDVVVTASMCAVLSACTVTASNLVSLITHETGDTEVSVTLIP